MRKKKTKPNKWDDTYYVQIYKYALAGLDDTKIAKLLKVTPTTFIRWRKEHPAIDDALIQARGTNKRVAKVTFRDYVFDKLPKKHRKLWKKINECADSPNGLNRLEAMFRKKGEDARKHMFLFAYTTTLFNPSVACKQVGITYRQLKRWCEDDADFAEMMDEIHYHKKNFYEHALAMKVAEGDAQSIMFANKTINRDRGFGDKLDVEVKGNIEVGHLVKLEELPLSTKMLRKIMKLVNTHTAETEEIETGKKGQKLLVSHNKGD